ncbi:MAG: thrombospondin type 3 repeat-containing protein [Patescibacteria group bacterium]
MNYLPSKKLVFSLLAIFAAGGMVFAASTKEEKPISRGSIKAQVIDPTSQNDTDNDGLKDWEEVIAGTDHQNPDTDGNGILDGVDRINTLAFQNEILDKDGALPLPTAELSRSFFGYLEERVQENGTLTKDDFDESLKEMVTNDTVAATQKILDQQNPYTRDDLRIDASVDPKTYFNVVGRVGEKYFPIKKRAENDFGRREIFIQLIEKKYADGTTMNDEEYQELLIHIAGFRSKYTGFASEIKNIPVPPELSDFHLSFTNFLANTALAVHHISLLDADPVLGLIGIEHYMKQLQAGWEILSVARSTTKKYNIIFTDQDSPYAKYHFGSPTL